MATWRYRDMAGEICGNEGPTDEYVEVLEVAVCDYGGNEYGRATTAEAMTTIRDSLRIPIVLKATRVGERITPNEAEGAAAWCGLVPAPIGAR